MKLSVIKRAESVNSLQVLGSCLSKAKAAIHRTKHPATLAATSTKGRNAQIALIAKRWSLWNGCNAQ